MRNIFKIQKTKNKTPLGKYVFSVNCGGEECKSLKNQDYYPVFILM